MNFGVNEVDQMTHPPCNLQNIYFLPNLQVPSFDANQSSLAIIEIYLTEYVP